LTDPLIAIGGIHENYERSMNGGRFNEGAVPFIRKLIAQNRQLFKALAQR